MKPETLQALLPTLESLQKALHADDVMLWILQKDGQSLKAVHSTALPLDFEFSQPLTRGVTAQAFLTGLPLLEESLQQNKSYDPSFDTRTGCTVRSLMASPIWQDEEAIGVLTAAIFTASAPEVEFASHQLGELASAACTLFDD